MKVPFVDLSAQYQSLKNDIDAAIATVIADTAFISGKYAKKFEEEFAAYAELTHCIACGNGTDSLEILLQAMQVGNGHEVIVPANSWMSTAEAVTTVGATPVFCDVDSDYLLDLHKVESLITSKTKAIIPVHLYGNAVDMNALMVIAEKNNLMVLEDCAQSHGATVGGKKAGTFGHCASYSFYPGKNLGAYGDAGAMLTNDQQLARTARAIANHGQEGKHNHTLIGRNSRMDGIQAAILSAKLPHIDVWTEKRIAHAKMYNALLKHRDIIIPNIRENFRHVFHLYVIQVPDRNGLSKYLAENGIETAVHYPTPLPLTPCYKSALNSEANFAIASHIQSHILSLPMYAELKDEQIEYVAEKILAFHG